MMIKTRYRDVPWEEIAPFHGPNALDWETSLRGKPITIVANPQPMPALGESWEGFRCEGPWYKVVGTEDDVCPHLAEIGD